MEDEIQYLSSAAMPYLSGAWVKSGARVSDLTTLAPRTRLTPNLVETFAVFKSKEIVTRRAVVYQIITFYVHGRAVLDTYLFRGHINFRL